MASRLRGLNQDKSLILSFQVSELHDERSLSYKPNQVNTENLCRTLLLKHGKSYEDVLSDEYFVYEVKWILFLINAMLFISEPVSNLRHAHVNDISVLLSWGAPVSHGGTIHPVLVITFMMP